MAEEAYKYPSNKDVIDHNSDEDIKELMQIFGVSEEDVNVAIEIVGHHREKLEEYLSNRGGSRFYNIW